MKRSQINSVILKMENLLNNQKFYLPEWASWAPEQWSNKKNIEEIVENKLGWDITDFGLGNYEKQGFALFTIRNGNVNQRDKYPKTYAEKLLMMFEGQDMCTHYHINKTEDIINRGGNDLIIRVWNGLKKGDMLDSPVTISLDGIRHKVDAGSEIRLKPGQSITITPYLYHRFSVPKTGGSVLIGEVSSCNDDDNDNIFFDKVGRFPSIEEDEPPYRLLCTEYSSYIG